MEFSLNMIVLQDYHACSTQPVTLNSFFFSLDDGKQRVPGLQIAPEAFPVVTCLWHACLTLDAWRGCGRGENVQMRRVGWEGGGGCTLQGWGVQMHGGWGKEKMWRGRPVKTYQNQLTIMAYIKAGLLLTQNNHRKIVPIMAVMSEVYEAPFLW